MSHPALSEQMHGREQPVNVRHKPAPGEFEELSANIVHQLSTRPLTANTPNAIRSLSRCITEVPNRCAMLYQFAIEWYQAILRNEFASLPVKRDVFIYEFENAVWARDYEHALAAAEHASSQFPSDMAYKLMRANALILLGRFGEAELILRQARTVRAEPGQEHQENIDTLFSMLAEYRSRQRLHRNRNHLPATVAP
jgi:predicted Zn-dependent protease